jgi:Phosphotransferase enzyme family
MRQPCSSQAPASTCSSRVREDHYTHGWLPAVLPAAARRYRVVDETLEEVLASVGAEIVDDDPDVEIAPHPGGIRGDAPLALITIDPAPTRGTGRLRRRVRGVGNAVGARARARHALRGLRQQGYTASPFFWDVRKRAELPFLAVRNATARERLKQRAVALGQRGESSQTALEAALADAEQSIGQELSAEWASIRVGVVVVAARSGILRVAIGGARTQIQSQFETLEALERSGCPTAVAERIPWVIARGRTGLAEWSFERRLPGSEPSPPIGGQLLEDCFDFLVGLRRAGSRPEDDRAFAQLALEPGSVAAPETAGILRQLGEELDRALAGIERGFAHGDFFAGNLLAAGGRLTGVLDWDGGGPGRVPALDFLHLQLTSEPYGHDDQWGRAVIERLLPSARAGGKHLLRRYCAEVGIEATPRLLEALVYAYWLEYVAYQLRTHLDRRRQPAWIAGNIELVARAAEAFMKATPGRNGPAASTRTA